MYSGDGIDCWEMIAERRRLVKVFIIKAGASPEHLRETGAQFSVMDIEGGAFSFSEYGWYHESLRPIWRRRCFCFTAYSK